MSEPRLPLLISLLLSFSAACGSRDDTLGTRCKASTDCDEGQLCKGGVCADPSLPGIASGEQLVWASGRAEGAEAVVDVSAQGGTCQDSSCSVRRGASVTFRTPAVEDFRFVGWSGDAPCVGQRLERVLDDVDSDVQCVASYVKRLKVRGLVENEAGVAAAASEEPAYARCAGSECEVDSGALVTLTAPERLGHRLTGWTGEDCQTQSGVLVQVTVGERDVSCTARYGPGFLVRAVATGADAQLLASSLGRNSVCSGASCQVELGGDVSLSAPLVNGARFVGWSGAAACLGNERALQIASVNDDLTCSAAYVPRFRVLGVSEGAAPSPAIPVSSSDSFASCNSAGCEVDEGGSATLRAPSVAGYRFTGWSGACQGQSGVAAALGNVRANLVCTARYVRGVSVSGATVGASAVVQAESTSAGAACTGGSCVIDAGGSTTLSVGGVTGFTFNGWTGDSGCSSSAPAITLSNVTSSKVCFANFSPLRFRVAASVSGSGGSISSSSASATGSCDSGGCTVDHGSSVTLSALPAAGYEFNGWTGCTTSSAASITRSNVTAAQSCVASFSLRSYSLQLTLALPATKPVGTMTSDSGGSCMGNSCTIVVQHGADVVVHLVYENLEDIVIPTSWGACPVRSTTPEGSGRFAVRLGPITSSGACSPSFEPGVSHTAISISTNGTISSESAYCSALEPRNIQCAAPLNAQVRFSVHPLPGFVLSHWLCVRQGVMGNSNVTGNPVVMSSATPGSLTCYPQLTAL